MQVQDEVEHEHDDTPCAVEYGDLEGVRYPNMFLGLVCLVGDPPQPH